MLSTRATVAQMGERLAVCVCACACARATEMCVPDVVNCDCIVNHLVFYL